MLRDVIELLAYVSIIVIAIVEVRFYCYIRIEMQNELQDAADNIAEAPDEISDK